MNKVEYFKISEKHKLSFRCPILNVCERRLLSIYFFGFIDIRKNQNYLECLIENGTFDKDKIDDIIEIRGEEPDYINGNTIKAFNNFCPEVNLFDTNYAFSHAKGTACISGEWDDFRHSIEKFKATKHCHFSECPEFNYYLSLTLKNRKSNRISISKQLRFEVLQRDNFTCQYCGKKAEDGVKLHIDHKIPVYSGGKTEFSNLITSCEDCNLGKSNKSI